MQSKGVEHRSQAPQKKTFRRGGLGLGQRSTPRSVYRRFLASRVSKVRLFQLCVFSLQALADGADHSGFWSAYERFLLLMEPPSLTITKENLDVSGIFLSLYWNLRIYLKVFRDCETRKTCLGSIEAFDKKLNRRFVQIEPQAAQATGRG